VFFVGEMVGGNEVEEEADELAVFESLDECLSGHITIR